jgi:signal transduction histidine kinase
VTLSQDDDCSVYSVQNRGEPIPAGVIPHLFDPRARYSSYAATEKGSTAGLGLGLGLFIASEIVTAHGGKIGVVSTPEQGTNFRVQLPII